MALGVIVPAMASAASSAPPQVEFISQVPQRPDQRAFNARVHSGTILMVAAGPTGSSMPTPFCTGILSLKQIWKQSGRDLECSTLWTGSRVKVLEKTRAYTVDDPTQPVEPYTNDAHLVIEVMVLSVKSAGVKDAARLVGKTGYVVVDDLDWPRERP
jgi:hypothetical protein